MKINILRLTVEFKYPTIFDYQNVKKFINIISCPTIRINMEDVTYYKSKNELENSHSHIIIYNEPSNIIKQLDNKIEEKQSSDIKNRINV